MLWIVVYVYILSYINISDSRPPSPPGCRLGSRAPQLPVELACLASLARRLLAAGRGCLHALEHASVPSHPSQPAPGRAPGPAFSAAALLDAAPLHAGATSSSPLTALSYAPATAPSPAPSSTASAQPGAPPHTDRGLLTLVFSTQPGLEVRLDPQAPWAAVPSGERTIALLPGELLQYVTRGAVPAVEHRVEAPPPGQPARRSLVLRLRGRPGAALLRGPGVFGRYGDVVEFDAAFEASHCSVNRPPRDGRTNAVQATQAAAQQQAAQPAAALIADGGCSRGSKRATPEPPRGAGGERALGPVTRQRARSESHITLRLKSMDGDEVTVRRQRRLPFSPFWRTSLTRTGFSQFKVKYTTVLIQAWFSVPPH